MSLTLINPPEECLAAVYKEYNMTWDQLQLDVQSLLEWLDQQPHLPSVLDSLSMQSLFMRCKCSMERTKQVLDMHYTLKTVLPDFFSDRDPLSRELQTAMNHMTIAILPRPTKEGYRIGVYKMACKDTKEYTTEGALKYTMMIADLRRAVKDQAVGDIFVLDYTNLMMGHVTKATLPLVKKMEMACMKGYATRVRGLHFINAPPVFDVLLKLLKTALKPKIAARVHVHSNLESLYEHVDRDLLPSDYGGKEKTVDELGADWRRDVESHRAWYQALENLETVDESKRPGKTVNVSELFGFEGTFKRLTVD